MEEFAHLLEEYLTQSEDVPRIGDKVKGVVVHLDRDFAFVDIGTKKEARIPIEEIKTRTGDLLFNVGDSVSAVVVKRLSSEGAYLLSVKKVLEEEAWESLKEAKEKDLPLEVTILRPVKGGFEVLYRDLLKGFLPSSQLALKGEVEGKEVPVLILKLSDTSFVASHRSYLQREREFKLKRLEKRITEEGIVEGRVKGAIKGGYLIDFDDVLTGFLPASEVTRRRGLQKEISLSEGDKFLLKVLSWDPEKKKLKVSLKALEPDPWEGAPQRYRVDQVIKGQVVKVFNFGAFVEVEPGLEGLLPASEISWKRGLKPKDVLSEGDQVEVVITDFDPGERRMIFSLKKLEESPWERASRELKVGDIVEGVIKTITSFGLFMEVLEGLDGFVHISQVSWERVEDLKSLFKPGDRVSARIIELDPEKRRLVLSLKEVAPDPWEEVAKKYKPGDLLEVEVKGEAKDKGYFVKVQPGVVGFLPLRELSSGEKAKRELKEGDRIKVKIIHFEPEKRRLWVSERAYLMEEEKREIDSYRETQGSTRSSTLGRVIKEKLEYPEEKS